MCNPIINNFTTNDSPFNLKMHHALFEPKHKLCKCQPLIKQIDMKQGES